MGVDQQGNAVSVLGALLGELAWSLGLLAEAVNGLLGPALSLAAPCRTGCTTTGFPGTRCPRWWPT